MDMDSMSLTNASWPSEWLPLIKLDATRCVGLYSGALWIGDQVAPRRRIDSENSPGLLSLLERPYANVSAEVSARESELGLQPGALVDRLQLTGIPVSAARTGMPYWIGLALDWMSEMPPADVDIATLEQLSREPQVPQPLRHRAGHLARAIVRTRHAESD